MYTFSILGFFDTPFFSFFMGPLTLSYKPAHSLTYSQLLSSMRSSILSLSISLFHCFFVALNSPSTITAALMFEYLRWLTTAFRLWRRAETFGWDWVFFLLVTCFATAPRCVHMGSPSHVEGRGAAYLCYWFSHWLRFSFGKWKHAVCRKQDLELSLWDVCMSWNVLVHRKKKKKNPFGCSNNVMRCWKCSPVSVLYIASYQSLTC